MPAALIDGALDSELFATLSGRLVGRDSNPFESPALWMDLAAKPRLLVEHAIHAVSRYLPPLPQARGVEWWVLARASSIGWGWHCDIDNLVLEQQRRRIHPLMNAILYFEALGGPTLVLDQTVDDAGRRVGVAERGVACLPRPNRLAIFRGDRVHAVAAREGDETIRVTLAMAWWENKPGAPHCIDATYDAPAFAAMAMPEPPSLAPPAGRVAEGIALSAQDIASLGYKKTPGVYPVWAR